MVSILEGIGFRVHRVYGFVGFIGYMGFIGLIALMDQGSNSSTPVLPPHPHPTPIDTKPSSRTAPYINRRHTFKPKTRRPQMSNMKVHGT